VTIRMVSYTFVDLLVDVGGGGTTALIRMLHDYVRF
jgi:hypothetical protein